jgi:hypothetical protein
MRQSFEPSDGSFEVILDKDECLDPGWNIPGVVVFRETEPNKFTRIKDYMEII